MERSQAKKYAEELESLFAEMFRLFQESGRGKQWDLEITMPQFVCLKMLEAKNNCMMKELAEKMQLCLGTVTGIIDRLIRAGFVERYRDEKDRRVVRVKLAKAGKEIIRKAMKKRREHLANILGKVDEADFKMFVDSFKKLVVTISTEKGLK